MTKEKRQTQGVKRHVRSNPFRKLQTTNGETSGIHTIQLDASLVMGQPQQKQRKLTTWNALLMNRNSERESTDCLDKNSKWRSYLASEVDQQ